MEAAKLTHARSMVLSRAPASPQWVGIRGTERREYVCVAMYSSTLSAQWDFVQPRGDQEAEWVLKSPTSKVGIVGSKSSESKVGSVEGSSMS